MQALFAGIEILVKLELVNGGGDQKYDERGGRDRIPADGGRDQEYGDSPGDGAMKQALRSRDLAIGFVQPEIVTRDCEIRNGGQQDR